VVTAVHKSLEEMVQELVQKSNLCDSEINALVEVDDVAKIDVTAVLRRAGILAAFRERPIGEMHRAGILVRSIHAAKLIIHPTTTSDSEESRIERHHEKMSDGRNAVAHLDRGAVNNLDSEK
jgi:hypothetical protein